MASSAKLYASDNGQRAYNTRVDTPALKTRKGSGGTIILIGPKWGPSMVTGRSDDSGCGVLTEVQLRTVQGNIHILGTYWPSKPESTYFIF